jgi:histidyl-tRNA synthetase
MSTADVKIRAVKGMNDILPDEIARWHRLEAAYARTMALHGFREVRTPYVEPTPLFTHAIGEETDIVEKEMYSFVHREEALTLRPEGTAGAARAYVEHGIQSKEPVTRWYYAGAMFRAERPQRGRYRQFYQLGAEIFGDPGPGCDAELIDMLVGFLNDIEVPGVEVLVNSLGGPQVRLRYKEALVAHLGPKKEKLSAESQRRLGTNPLRILDSKSEADQAAVADAPTIHEFFDDDDRAHFAALQRYLGGFGTPFRVEPKLVRGLDYYTRTLFEIKGAKAKLGAGDTLLGGGRYDGMVKDLGGPEVPAIGFAAGLERLLIASDMKADALPMDAFVAPLGATAVAEALVLGRQLRKAGIPCEVDTRGSSLKSQLRRADARGARVVLILGDDEIAKGVVQLKDLQGHTQESIARDKVVPIVVDRLVAASRGIDSRPPRNPPQGKAT